MAASSCLDSFSQNSFPASYRFQGYIRSITASVPQEVLPALQEVEVAVAQGFHVVGLISYEAATAIQSHLSTHAPGPLPLLSFLVYREKTGVAEGDDFGDDEGYTASDWKLSLSSHEYEKSLERIKQFIAAGDTYQVNYTTGYDFAFKGDPLAFYHRICLAQQAPFCAFIDLGRLKVLSASPELFFALKDGILTCRPMKGTAPRGRWEQEDGEARESLRSSTKDRAENVMIVDLLRNDMGVISETGSVEVSSLFDVEPFPSLFQMTSTITSRVKPGTSVTDIIRALFPCGSVTGAPKKRAMEIISELENGPRGIYTGCIGYISPGPEAVFSVAIRTAILDTLTGRGELGIGSGITYDSKPSAEYAECETKSLFARKPLPPFRLLESILFEDDCYFLLERHLRRLFRSAAQFGFRYDEHKIRRTLETFSRSLIGRSKIRLLLHYRGEVELESTELPTSLPELPLSVVFARQQVDSRNPLLYHKTDSRDLFTHARMENPGADEVIFLNERGEVTEGSYHNVVARVDGVLVTPSLSSGLLPGVFREELMEHGKIKERILTRHDFEAADEIYLINSVRRWRQARLL